MCRAVSAESTKCRCCCVTFTGGRNEYFVPSQPTRPMNAVSLVSRLLGYSLATPETIVPCSPQEVKFVEDFLAIRLPDEYRSFLMTAGKCAGRFLADVDFYYPEILRNRHAAIEKLTDWESNGLQLPPDAFVFGYRPAEQFWFFPCRSGAPTDVFWYYEGRGTFEQLPMTFWGFVEAHLSASESLLARYPGKDEWWHRFHSNALKRASWVRELGIPPAC
jgi:SMI1 / KNR4 family (SUKH-1)